MIYYKFWLCSLILKGVVKLNSEKKTNSTDDKVVVVKNLTKTYGKFHAVDNISLSIKKGEAVGFLGLNGAGKSTTMDMLTGCLDPTAGSIEICGHNIAKQPNEAKKQVGYLPSDSPVYDNLTVLEYLKFVCELKCVKNVKKEVDRVVEETALGDKVKKYISTLSKGYRQRVGLAQALIGDPAVLILDEPTSGLDPSQVVSVRNLFKDLSKNHTVIFSTHVLSEIENVCSRLLIINRGRIIANDVFENLGSDAPSAGSRIYSLRVCCENSYDIEPILKSFDENSRIANLIKFPGDIIEFDLEVSKQVGEEKDIYLNVSKLLIAHDISILQFKNKSSQSVEKIFLNLVKADDEKRAKETHNVGGANREKKGVGV